MEGYTREQLNILVSYLEQIKEESLNQANPDFVFQTGVLDLLTCDDLMEVLVEVYQEDVYRLGDLDNISRSQLIDYIRFELKGLDWAVAKLRHKIQIS